MKTHNYLYRNIVINNDLLDSFVPEAILPFHIEHICASPDSDAPMSRYDATDDSQDTLTNHHAFESILISDVDVHASPNELKAAAIRHLTRNGAGFIQVTRGSNPESEFDHFELFPKMFPSLFPYGIGGFEHPDRKRKISLRTHAKHLLRLTDDRFQTHHAFQFIAFNILQRREVLRGTHSRVQRRDFDTVARRFNGVTTDEIEAVSERMSKNEFTTAYTEGERITLQLMKEVNNINTRVAGTSASHIAMRNEIRGLMIAHGMPSLFLTINPADVYNPLVQLLAGESIDIDALLPEEIPNYWDQSILIAHNPVLAAEFFNTIMTTFIKCLLAYVGEGNWQIGTFSVTKAYYGCVEAQGRGTLHCHMLIWLEGGLGPNALRDRLSTDPLFQTRLISYIKQTICTSAPAPITPIDHLQRTYHPRTVRRPQKHPNETYDNYERRLADDFHLLVEQCQRHKHTHTCYKYDPTRTHCRFNLDAANIVLETIFNPDTGEINFEKLDGLLNNFNKVIIASLHCNMDISFIGSGPDAKAILFYITDYITKSQLPTHIAYTILEYAVRNFEIIQPFDHDTISNAKSLLRKCANSLIAKQELSAQQVSCHLLGYDAKYTSHQFNNLYWPAFESYLVDNCEDSEDTSIDTLQTKHLNAEYGDVIALTTDDDGRLAPRNTQVADYIYRPKASLLTNQ